jgi:hypothetical protein
MSGASRATVKALLGDFASLATPCVHLKMSIIETVTAEFPSHRLGWACRGITTNALMEQARQPCPDNGAQPDTTLIAPRPFTQKFWQEPAHQDSQVS